MDRNASISMNVSREQIIVMIMQLASTTSVPLAVPVMLVTLEMEHIVKVCFPTWNPAVCQMASWYSKSHE